MAVEKAMFVVVGVIGAIIGITALLSQAPTVATLTNTATGSALANAGITGNTLAGTVYGFMNVFWALAGLGLAIAVVYLGGKKAGYF